MAGLRIGLRLGPGRATEDCPFAMKEVPVIVPVVLDSAGRRRSPATMPRYHAGRVPRNKGMRYPADPPTVEEIIAVMRQTGDNGHGWRLRALIVVLWRGGLRIREALALSEPDLIPGADRCWCATARVGAAARSEWMLGVGSSCAPGLRLVSICLSDRCSASSTAPPRDEPGQAPVFASSCAGSPLRRGCDVGSRLISCGTPTRSSSRERAYR